MHLLWGRKSSGQSSGRAAPLPAPFTKPFSPAAPRCRCPRRAPSAPRPPPPRPGPPSQAAAARAAAAGSPGWRVRKSRTSTRRLDPAAPGGRECADWKNSGRRWVGQRGFHNPRLVPDGWRLPERQRLLLEPAGAVQRSRAAHGVAAPDPHVAAGQRRALGAAGGGGVHQVGRPLGGEFDCGELSSCFN